MECHRLVKESLEKKKRKNKRTRIEIDVSGAKPSKKVQLQKHEQNGSPALRHCLTVCYISNIV